MTALPDVKMLQAMTLTKLKLMQKAADPPMWLKDDGVVGQTRTVPGGINYWRGNPNEGVMLQPVSLQGLQAIEEGIKGVREQILRSFFADIMRMTDRADMTATEVIQRTAEQMRLFGPLIGRLESEFLGPLVERVFGILSRMGLFPDAPPIIEDQEFTVEYVSPIATAQKQQSANGIVQVMQLISAFGPDIAAHIAQNELDVGKLFRWLWDLFNNDPDLLKSDEAMEADNQTMQMSQQLQMGGGAADVALKGSGAVRNIADAVGKSGMDVGKLIQQFQAQVGRNPRAQMEMKALMNGESPTAP